MLLVPYPFASILSIVFPSLRFLSNLHAFIFGLRAVYSFACFASQTQGLCSAFPRPSFKFVRFCLSRIVLRTSPHKHRVCAMLFPRSPLKFVRLCLLCYVMLCYASSIGLQNQLNMVWYRVRVLESQRHIPTQKYTEYPCLLGQEPTVYIHVWP